MLTPPPTWDDLAWLRETWDGPLMVKGVMPSDDARRAVDAGATAISVSNHGGNNLDGTPASIRALPGVVDAVGGEIEVLLDGGIRRGSDVVKALALGARAVMIGRAYLWGLAANGEAGVANVLEILRAGSTRRWSASAAPRSTTSSPATSSSRETSSDVQRSSTRPPTPAADLPVWVATAGPAWECAADGRDCLRCHPCGGRRATFWRWQAGGGYRRQAAAAMGHRRGL